MRSPIIGITPQQELLEDQPPKQMLSAYYTEAVRRAGGTPLIIPIGLAEQDILNVVERLDGVILSGGGDIEVHHFNGDPRSKILSVDPQRDTLELTLVRHIARSTKPFFGHLSRRSDYQRCPGRDPAHRYCRSSRQRTET
jgi:putative glutamine amidotransferase